jgi:hypothetical protein
MQAQDAVVRMHFDAEFAALVRRAPAEALPDLPELLRSQLAAIDPRAFKLDRLRGRRLLRTLFDELKASTTLVLAREQRLAFLDGFFSSPAFSQALDGSSVVLAYSLYLMMHHDDLGGVIAIESALALGRRPGHPHEQSGGQRVWRAAGVQPVVSATQGDLAALQQAEQYLFEVGLMPAVALCSDAPTLVLDERTHDPTPVYLVVVPTEAGQSLVTVDAQLHRLLMSLPLPYSPELQPLIDDEIAVRL